MELAQGNIGAEAKYEAKFEGGKLLVTVTYQGVDAEASFTLSFSASAVAELLANKLKAAIPGTIDDAVIDMVLAGLKAA